MRKDELQVYRNLLLDLRSRTREDLNGLVEVVLSTTQSQGEHDDCPSESAEKAIVLEHTEEELRYRILGALDRIENGSYGHCVRCRRSIAKTRLRAIPHAERCMRCEQLLENQV